jgi:SOS response regulatory protein OraA/RecX
VPKADALTAARKLLAARERTESQLLAALTRQGHDAEAIRAALDRMKALGFLSNQRAAETHARKALGARHPRASVLRKLESVGIDSAQARQVVEAVGADLGHTDDDAARALLKQRSLTGLKAARFLIGRGFDEALVRRVVRDLPEEP